MTPQTFFYEVAHPNVVAASREPEDRRAMVNAVLTLDALVGFIYAHGRSVNNAALAKHETEDGYRDALALSFHGYQVIREAAAALRHGELAGEKMQLAHVIADSYRMLKQIVESEPARTDEHDRGTFDAMMMPARENS